ncbi:Putative secreted protein [Candidatus Arthromitus sp. SFB-2]|nr:Putative secreted protein [Candidatus Arthromitus sp. SFB-2]
MIEVDAVIITHLHIDYFDEEAKQQLPKNVPIYV